ncbi:type IV pilus biogenesis/stability protein PilW [Alteromonas sp. 14N.309.X.WAT.G.H12]|uniref:type IV pilus biogenesis/stability protein PilW n=1 Tax=Alteromonas sp. 14N.309.X.WAT.G.H12 TaxID=3120824 RepID=UPI002FD0E241
MRLVVLAVVIVLTGCVSQNSTGSFQGEKFDLQEAAKTRVSLGLTYLKNGNYQQAKKNLDKALTFAPRNADVHYALAYYYQTVEEWDRAESSYEDALRLAPRDGDVANSYGAYLCQQKQYDKATVYFKKALDNTQYANSAQTYENMGICAEARGATDTAISYLKSALNHQPGRPSTLFMLTELYIKTQQWDDASETLRRYEKVSKVTPESIQMAIEIAEGKGEDEVAQGYGEMLISLYPHSQAAKAFIAKLQAKEQQSSVVKRIKALNETAAAAMDESSAPDNNNAAQPDEASAPDNNNDAQPDEVPATANNTTTQTDHPPVPEKPNSMIQNTAKQGGTDTASAADSAADRAPDSSTQSPSPSSTADAVATDLNNNEESAESRYHVVKRGENLYRISLRYNIKMARLLEWNNIVDPSEIEVGMKLRLTPPQ